MNADDVRARVKAQEAEALAMQEAGVVPGSRWRHSNGIPYTVLHLANVPGDERYPLTVVYQGENGRVWARQASDWLRSMAPIKEPAPETAGGAANPASSWPNPKMPGIPPDVMLEHCCWLHFAGQPKPEVVLWMPRGIADEPLQAWQRAGRDELIFPGEMAPGGGYEGTQYLGPVLTPNEIKEAEAAAFLSGARSMRAVMENGAARAAREEEERILGIVQGGPSQ